MKTVHASSKASKWDEMAGKTRVVVTVDGVEHDAYVVAGGPLTALRKVHADYRRMADLGALAPGAWRLAAAGQHVDIEVRR